MLEPSLAGGSVGGSRSNQAVAVGLERLDVLLPKISAALRSHIRLSLLIGPADAQTSMTTGHSMLTH